MALRYIGLCVMNEEDSMAETPDRGARRPFGFPSAAFERVPLLLEYRQQRSRLAAIAVKIAMFAAIGVCAWGYGTAFVVLPSSYNLPLLMPFAMTALLIVWALPERQDISPASRKALSGLFFALAIASIIWPNYLAISLPGLPWISLRRLISAPLILMFLVALSVSVRFRAEIKEVINVRPFMWRMLILFVVLQFVSIIFARDFGNAIKGFINWQITWTFVFFISAFIFSRNETAERWVRIVLALTFALCLLGLAEARAQQVLWVNHIPSFLKIDDPAVQTMLAGGFKGDQYRVQTTFTLSLSFAEYLALASAFCLYYIIYAKSLLVRLFMIIFDVLILISILLTISRLGLVGFIVTHAVSIFIWGLQKWRSDRASLVAPTVVLSYPALLIALAAVVLTVPAVHNRVLGGGQTQYSNQARDQQWVMAVPKILSRPLGNGPSQGAQALGYANLAGEMTLDSYFLLILLDFGILPFFLFYGMAIYAAYIALSFATRLPYGVFALGLPIASAALAFVTMRYVLILADNNVMMMMIIGMVVGIDYQAFRKQQMTP